MNEHSNEALSDDCWSAIRNYGLQTVEVAHANDPQSGRIGCSQHWQANLSARILGSFAVTYTFIALLIILLATRLAFANESLPCKYSVRDVAFVDVHGEPWQLHLLRPPRWSRQKFDHHDAQLRNALRNSNLSWIWHDAQSPEGKRLIEQSGKTDSIEKIAVMSLVGPDGFKHWVENDHEQSFEQTLTELTDSPTRSTIVRELANSLCVVLVVLSAEDKKNKQIISVATQAQKSVDKQLWSLAKAPKQGAKLVTLDRNALDREHWLRASLGIDQATEPVVAIIYGKGRMLGEPLTGKQITLDNIVSRAKLCGHDCECSLSRDWLYGRQMLLTWSEEAQLQAEESLGFDPKSALVIQEVSQILQKNSKRSIDAPPTTLGSGLIIHDLDSLPNASQAETDSKKQLARNEHSTALSKSTAQSKNPSQTKSTAQSTNQRFNIQNETASQRNSGASDSQNGENSSTNIPWTLISILGCGVAASMLWIWLKR